MKYTKSALSFEQQAQRLLDRGLIAPDKETLARYLSEVNYYRLSAYWYHFKRIRPATGDEYFAPDTTFVMIWWLYTPVVDRGSPDLLRGARSPHKDVPLGSIPQWELRDKLR